jgi:hypothetical protein
MSSTVQTMKETTLAALVRSNPDLPRVALSIRQPWAYFVVNGFKDVENRTWKTDYRGPVLIHASQKPDGIYLEDEPMLRRGGVPKSIIKGLTLDEARPGGIVGVAELVDCVSKSKSPWFTGPYAFVFNNPIRLPFVPLKGKLRFFRVV